jgi:hypothetical protein
LSLVLVAASTSEDETIAVIPGATA